MAENFLISDMPIRMGECGPDGKLRHHIWLDYFQHIAAIHAEQLGFGISAIRRNNLIWVLSRIKLHLDDSPRFDDILRLETYPNGTDKLFAKRQFILRSAKTGVSFGYASSFWLTLELPSFRPRPPGVSLGTDFPVNADRSDFFPQIPKLHIPDGQTEDPFTIEIGASRIDLNNHLNNTCYCEFVLDWLSRKTGKIVHFREIQINFNRAMKFGETLVVSGKLDGTHFYVEGVESAEGKNSFQAEGEYGEL